MKAAVRSVKWTPSRIRSVNILLLLSVILRRRSLRVRSVHKVFIANLALSDLLTLGYWMTFFVLDLILGSDLNRLKERDVTPRQRIQPRFQKERAKEEALSSALSLTSITLNRYLHVCHDRIYTRIFSLKTTIVWCLMVWVAAAVIAFPPLVGGGSYHYNPKVLLQRRFLRVQSVHKVFIASLALCDLLTLGYWMTYFVLDLYIGRHPVVNMAHCQANAVIVAITFVGSALSLTSITLNRYLHVCHDRLYSRIFSLRTTLVWCLMIWVISAMVVLPPSWGTGSYHYNPIGHFCSFNREDPNPYPKIVVMFCTLIPMILIGYWNYAIYRFWKNARAKLKKGQQKSRSNKIKKRRGLKCWKSGEDDTAAITTHPQLDQGQGYEGDTSCSEDGLDSCDTKDCQSSEEQPQSIGADAKPSSRHQETSLSADEAQPKLKPLSALATARKLVPRPTKPRSRERANPLKQLQSRQKAEQSKEEAFVRSLRVVFFLLLISFFPYGISIAVNSYFPLPAEVAISANIFLYTNNALNWIVYGAMNPSFRRGYIKNLRWLFGLCSRARSAVTKDTTATSTSQSQSQTYSTDAASHTDTDVEKSVTPKPKKRINV
nr:hypothetical protein BaRGS_014421 [Batillaria attramentaria]